MSSRKGSRDKTPEGKNPRLPSSALLITVSLYQDHALARVVAAPTLHDLRTDRLLGAVRLDTGQGHLVGLSAPDAVRVVAMSLGRAMAEVAERFGTTAAGPGAPDGATGRSLDDPRGEERPTLF